MTDEPKNPIENLILRHFEGGLTEEQERELAEALATSAEAKRLFLSYMRMEGRLHSLGRDGFLREPSAVSATESDPLAPVVRSGQRSLRSRLWTASASLAVCAALILMLSWSLSPSPVNANSVLQRARQAASELVDRTYRLTLSYSQEEDRPPREYTITARGGGRFVIQPDRQQYVMGSDGADYWLARRRGPVWVTEDFRSLVPELQRQIPSRRLLELVASPDEPLLMEMSALLSHIAKRYDVELVDSPGGAEHHVRATRRARRRGGPDVMDLRMDANSGVLLRAEMERFGVGRARLELIKSPPRSDRWYHFSEHAPDRPVERVDAATAP